MLINLLNSYDYFMAIKVKENTKAKKTHCIITEREKDYLILTALGYKNPQIAEVLNVSYYTVKKTLEIVFSKLQAVDRTSAVTIAFLHKIIDVKEITTFAKEHNVNNSIIANL